jgi:organic hydroperoxide reductase OsmC/OhrA
MYNSDVATVEKFQQNEQDMERSAVSNREKGYHPEQLWASSKMISYCITTQLSSVARQKINTV